ncbi:MAG: cytidine deaminase [Pseudomonadota bacterium]|nr:cytidine deaminase [Pseudomonadota bacterium]
MDENLQRELLAAARGALSRAYAPYSGFRVAAALLLDDGAIVTGVNVENVSYGLTICAERSAMVTAVGAGHERVRAVAIATDPSGPCTPCGACRQVLAEFATQEAVVIVESTPGQVRLLELSALLPEAFSRIPGRPA